MFNLWPTAFVDDVSKIPAIFLNDYVRVPISRALDGIQGGTYALVNNLVITGAGLVLDYIQMSGTNKVQLAERTVPRVMPDMPMSHIDAVTGDPDWAGDFLGMPRNEKLAGSLYIPLRVPHGATLQTVEVVIAGSGGHSGLPADMPIVYLYEVDIVNGTSAALDDAEDDSASVAELDNEHAITISGLDYEMDRETKRLVAILVSESGTNALAGARYWGARVTYDISEYDED